MKSKICLKIQSGKYPLLAACEKGDVEFAKLLISAGADVNMTEEVRKMLAF